MKIYYKAVNKTGTDSDLEITGKSSSQVWAKLRLQFSPAGLEVTVANAELRARGWKVKRVIDTTETDGDNAEKIVGMVIGEKKASLGRKLLRMIGL